MNFMQVEHVKDTGSLKIIHTDESLYLPVIQVGLGVSASENIQDLLRNINDPEKEIMFFSVHTKFLC